MKFPVLLQYVTPHRRILLLALVLLLAESAAALANPWIAGRLTQSLIGPGDGALPGTRFILLAWLGLVGIKSLLAFSNQYLLGSTGERMLAGLRTRLYEHLQVLPMSYYHEQRPGNVLALLSNDAEVISHFVTDTLIRLLPLFITFLGAFWIMASLDPVVALLAALLMPIYFLAMKIIGRRIRPLSSSWVKSYAGMISLVEENLGLLPAIKSFLREPLESERFSQKNTRLLSLSRQQILIQSILSPAIGFLAGAGLLLLLWVGINHVQSGQLQTGDLVSLILYAMLLTHPISGLANVYGQIQQTRGSADRLLEFFAVQPEPFGGNKPAMTRAAGHIKFRDVSFAYPRRPATLCHLELEIQAGETVAIIGPNGAGKSTLAYLLMRFCDPASGRILIDGGDIRDFDLASLRAQIGLVAQHTLLLNGTVGENIAYGRSHATRGEIEEAARRARAHGFICELPDGYNTLIGDQGIRLSGGQRQRVSLARTLLKDPPILILDEATAMFDPQGEAGFIRECHQLLHQRTVIMITHRPASLALADRILRMHEGRLEPQDPS